MMKLIGVNTILTNDTEYALAANGYYFDKSKFDKMGFSKYKLVPPWESQQRTFIMYEKNKSLGGGDFQSYVFY